MKINLVLQPRRHRRGQEKRSNSSLSRKSRLEQADEHKENEWIVSILPCIEAEQAKRPRTIDLDQRGSPLNAPMVANKLTSTASGPTIFMAGDRWLGSHIIGDFLWIPRFSGITKFLLVLVM
ncbi:unnamed protein product, partial [Mesorhabditis spiculigera]